MIKGIGHGVLIITPTLTRNIAGGEELLVNYGHRYCEYAWIDITNAWLTRQSRKREANGELSWVPYLDHN
jgi:hypothetical protein